MPDTTALVAESPTADAPAPVCRPRRQPIPATRIANTNDLMKPGQEIRHVDRGVDLLQEGDDRNRERLHRDRAADQPHQAREQRQERRHQHGGDDARRHEEAHRVEAHRRQRVDFLVDAHRADFGGKRGARAAGQQDRRHQRPQFAQHRQPDQVRDEDLRAEALHRHGRLEREDHAEQERNQRDDRQRVRRRPVRRCARRRASAPTTGLRTACASADVVSPTNVICARMSRQTMKAARPISSIAGPRGGSGSRSCSRTARIELLEQDFERGLQVRDLDLRLARMAQQVDEERDAGAVAVVDAARVDDHAPRRRVGHGAAHRIPQRRHRGESRRPDRASTRPPSEASEIARAAVVMPGDTDQGLTSSSWLPNTRTRSPSWTNGS